MAQKRGAYQLWIQRNSVFHWLTLRVTLVTVLFWDMGALWNRSSIDGNWAKMQYREKLRRLFFLFLNVSVSQWGEIIAGNTNSKPFECIIDFRPFKTSLLFAFGVWKFLRFYYNTLILWKGIQFGYRPWSRGDNMFGSVCPCVRVSIGPFVYALLFELFGLWPWFLAWGSTLALAGLGL